MASLKQMSFSVKSDLNGDKRRFTFEASEGMAALQQKLATVYDSDELTLKYEDDEKDLVTLKTDEDLAEALNVLNGRCPLRVTVRGTTSPAAAAAEEKANFQPNFQLNTPEVMELIRNGLNQFKLMKQQFKQASRETKDGRPEQPHPNQEPAGLGVGLGKLGKQGNPVKQMPATAEENANFQPNFQLNTTEVMELIRNGLDQFKLMKQQFKQASRATKDGRHEQQEPAGIGVGLGKQAKQMARFVQHVTLPEGEKVPAGQSCTKTWRVRNDSVHTWPVGSTLILVSGKNADNIATAESFPVTAALAPSEETDLSVEVLAPAQPGFYQAFWRLQGPKGRKFGQRLGCSILVTDEQGAVISSSSDSDGDDAAAKVAKKEKKLLKQAQRKPPAKSAGAKTHPASDEAKKAHLRAMGYTHEGLLAKCLRKCNGDVELAAARLAHKREKLSKRVAHMAHKLAALSTGQAGPSTAPTAAGPPLTAGPSTAPTAAETPFTESEESEFEMVDEASGDAATA